MHARDTPIDARAHEEYNARTHEAIEDATPAAPPPEPLVDARATELQESPLAAAFAEAVDAPSLTLADGLEALKAAADRDVVFETLCLVGRGQFAFSALFSVQGDVATARIALGAGWADRAALAGASVDLAAPSSLRTVVQTAAPFIGRVGEDAALGDILQRLGRPAPLHAALVPVTLRGRTVAIVYLDDGGRVLDADELVSAIQVSAEASNAFLRLIKAAKRSGPAAPVERERTDRTLPRAVPSPSPAPPLPSTTAQEPPPPIAQPEPQLVVESVSRRERTDPTLPMVFAPPRESEPVAPPQDEPPPVRTSDVPEIRRSMNSPSTLRGIGPGGSTAGDNGLAAQPLGGASTAEVAALLTAFERDDDAGAGSALLALGADAAAAVARRFPGPLRFGHRKLHTVTLPLGEHGPLIALSARFGTLMAPLLLPRLADPTADTRFYAALVLAELRVDEAVSPLGQRVFDPDSAVRRAATMALGRYPPSPALRALLDGLRNELVSPDPNRQRHASMALGELRDAPSVPRLVDLLKHRDTETVDVAHRALVVITKQDFGTTRWRWRSWWEKNREQSRLAWLFGGLDQPSQEARTSAVEELSALATDRFGCHANFPRRDREDAVRRWAVWERQGLRP
jgi:hypothetical protein